MILKKVRLTSAITALILFTLPWLDIQCSDKSIATQSGLQMAYGGASVSEEFASDASESTEEKESLGIALLVAAALIAVLGAVIYAFLDIFRPVKQAGLYSSILSTTALVMLLFQLAIGFPAKNKYMEEMSESSSEQTANNEELDAFEQSMQQAVMASIRFYKTPFFYLELLALGIPALILLNGLIDKAKKGDEEETPA